MDYTKLNAVLAAAAGLPVVKMSTLTCGVQYDLIALEAVSTRFGPSIILTSKDFKCFLSSSIIRHMNETTIANVMRDCGSFKIINYPTQIEFCAREVDDKKNEYNRLKIKYDVICLSFFGGRDS